MPDLPPSSELFNRQQLVARHQNILNPSRVDWALRKRETNGLDDLKAVFECRGGELLVHEPRFLQWFLQLNGRQKPRRLRRGSRRAAA